MSGLRVLSTGFYILRSIKLFCFLLFCLFFLTFCGGSGSFDSIELNDCFSNHFESEIAKDLDNINQAIEKAEKPLFDYIALAGCYNYQLGNHVLADQLLNQAFNQSEDKEAKNVAASALGLIYLKNSQKGKIKPYISTATQHYLGRWMLVLYYIEYYREIDNKGDLSSAIKALETKHEEDGATSATSRLLAHMQQINIMEEHCINNPEGDSCSLDLEDEKAYLFDTAFGTLYRLLREQHPQSEEPSQSDDSA